MAESRASPRPALLNPGKESIPSSGITVLESADLSSQTAASQPSDQGTPKNAASTKLKGSPVPHSDPSQFNPNMDSPCFVHSYLDKGVTLWDTLKKQKRHASRDGKPRRRRNPESDSATEDSRTTDSAETPILQPEQKGEADGSYFDTPTHHEQRSSPIDTRRPGSFHPRTDEDAHSGSDASTVAQRKRIGPRRPQSMIGEEDEEEDYSDSMSERSSSYESSYSYSSGEEDDDRVRSLTRQLAETAVGVREMSKQLGRARVKSTIQSVLIITKARDNRLIRLTRELAIWLMTTPRNGKDTGLIVYVDSQLKQSKRFDAEGIKRDYPHLFDTRPKRTPSTSSSLSSASGYESSSSFLRRNEGQLRYWTSDMCSRHPHLFDFVVTLGGDGTVLFCSWLFQRIVPPVLPFALGSLGFLTNFDFADYQQVMKSALEDGIRVNLRMRFTATVYRATLPTSISADRQKRRAIRSGKTGEIIMRSVRKCGWDAIESPNPACGPKVDEADADGADDRTAEKKKKKKRCKDKEIMCFSTRPVETFEVLNDLVVDRGPSPYVSQLELFGDEHHMTTVQADGLCVSTPTGSTAYSLSAGGSLVHPEIPAILITPICPHTLSFRPMLLPDSMELRIAVPYNSRSTAWASFDGRGRVELKQGDHIKVTASRYPFPTVCAENQSTDWFSSISRTLKWNERQRQKSFVVVEEGRESSSPSKDQSGRSDERKGRAKTESFSLRGNDDDSDEDDEDDQDGGDEEDEDEDEAEHFDIDDTSTTVTRSNSPNHSTPGTPGEHTHARRRLSKGTGNGNGSRRTSGGGSILSNGMPRLTALTQADSSNTKSSSLLNSPDRFGIQGPPLPPKAISERHMLSADFRLDDGPITQQSTSARPRRRDVPATPSSALAQELNRSTQSARTKTSSRNLRESHDSGGTALVVYGDDESDSDSTTGA